VDHALAIRTDVPNENSSRKEFYRAAGAAAFVERRHTLVLISNDSWLLGEMANATRTLPITLVITLSGTGPGRANA
jgi:hypothetical protein